MKTHCSNKEVRPLFSRAESVTEDVSDGNASTWCDVGVSSEDWVAGSLSMAAWKKFNKGGSKAKAFRVAADSAGQLAHTRAEKLGTFSESPLFSGEFERGWHPGRVDATVALKRDMCVYEFKYGREGEPLSERSPTPRFSHFDPNSAVTSARLVLAAHARLNKLNHALTDHVEVLNRLVSARVPEISGLAGALDAPLLLARSDAGTVDAFLAIADQDRPELLVHALSGLLAIPSSRMGVVQFLRDGYKRWIDSWQIAAVIESAVKEPVPQIVPVLLDVLERSKSEQAAVIAAQRVRVIPVEDVALRERMGRAVLERIAAWEDTQPHWAALAIPSIPMLRPPGWSEWTALRLLNGTERLAWAAAMGVVEWGGSKQRHAGAPDVLDSERLFKAATSRLETLAMSGSESASLRSALVWSLGMTATRQSLSTAAGELVRAFIAGRDVDDAAAVRGGRALLRKFGKDVLPEFAAAFQLAGDAGTERTQMDRYLALLLA